MGSVSEGTCLGETVSVAVGYWEFLGREFLQKHRFLVCVEGVRSGGGAEAVAVRCLCAVAGLLDSLPS